MWPQPTSWGSSYFKGPRMVPAGASATGEAAGEGADEATTSGAGERADASGADTLAHRASAPVVQPAAEPIYPADQLDRAVRDALARHGLLDGTALGDLRGVTVGKRLHVAAATSDFPGYWLVSLERAGRTVALAIMTEAAGGIRFSSAVATLPGYVFPDAGAAHARLAAEGLPSTAVTAVWGWSAASASPFVPLWAATDGSGRRVVVDPSATAAGVSWDRPGAVLAGFR